MACTFSVYSQNDTSEKAKSFVIFEGCDNAEDIERCYEMKLQDFISNNLDSQTIEETIKSNEIDTITVYTAIRFDYFGETIRSNSVANSLSQKLDIKINELIHEKLPKVKPAVDASGSTIMITIKKRLGFKLDRNNNKLVPIYGYHSNEIPFVVVENVPIYPGCDEKQSNTYLKRCMSSKIAALVGSEFDLSLASKLGLPAGYVRINTTFKIDRDGKIIQIQARAAHPELEKEAERVLALLPDMIKPGIHKGQPVVVPYSLPIKFAVTGGNKKEKKND